MMPVEVEAISQPYKDKGFELWMTKCSDIESYWAETSVIASHFGIDDGQAKAVLDAAVATACADDAARRKRHTKRNEALQKIPEAKGGQLAQFGDTDVETEAKTHGDQHIVL